MDPHPSSSFSSFSSSADDLRRALLRTSLELESTRFLAQEELRRLEAHALHLSHLLDLASRERDEARLHAHSLLLLLDRPSPSSSDDTSPPPPAAAAADDDIDAAAAAARGLPEKGRLLEAVMRAGPLLQTLMLAGPLPEWRHPPPAMQGFEIPPVVMRRSGGRSPERAP